MSSSNGSNGARAPQAPPLPPSSRHRSTSFDTSNNSNSNNNSNGTTTNAPEPQRTASSNSSSGSRSQRKSSRHRSSSDGVRMMQQQFYEQQQYWNPYQMPMPMRPPAYQGYPPGFPRMSSSPSEEPRGHHPRHTLASSFSEGAPYGSFGPGPNSSAPLSHHLSMRPPQMPPPRSPNFSGFNELSSVMGSRARKAAPNGRPSFHRRSASESEARRHDALPPPPSHGRAPSFATDGDAEPRPFLAASLIPSSSSSRKSRSHMRQQSVNLYMKHHRGVEQPRRCRDAFFAALFLLQLAALCALGLRYGPDALVATSADLGPGAEDDAPRSEPEDEAPLVLAYWNVIQTAYTCGAFAVVVSACALAFMMAMSRRLVYVALVLSIGVSFAWGTIGIGISPRSFVPITGIIALMLTVGYMFVVWERIPFASANLTTALTGVRENLGLVCIAFECQFLALVGSIYYSFTFAGLHNAMCNGGLEVGDNWKVAVDVGLLVSYFWTYQVLRHIVIVTVAGTIGSWWFKQPSALYATFLQATVFNFGSICYGSLFVGFVQLLRQLTEGLRPNRDDSAMMCLYESCALFQERIVGCVDDLADAFTPYAFTYVGLYRYGLKEAGHRANELFDKRGWSRIVTDDLVPTVLAMVSLVIGGLTGSFAVILQALDGHGLTNIGHPEFVSFVIGFLIGIVLSTVLFSIISSSVAAVIVCFAGSPVEFHQNYPELSHEMRHAWREVWPGSLDVGGVIGLAA